MDLNVVSLVLATAAEHRDSIGRRTEVNHRVSGRSNALLRIGGRDEWVCGLWEGTGLRNGFGLGFWMLLT